MPKLRPLRDSWRDFVFAAIALLVIAADQFTKWWLRAGLAPGESLFDVGFFRIINAQNTGAAFGIFQGHPLVFTVIDFVGIIIFLGLVLWARSRWPWLGSMWILSGLALLLGGTVGNLIDRLRQGHVTDFLDFKIWPAFNVADSCITIGVIIIIFNIIFLSKSSGNRV
jgi:signal peptidase II